MHEFIQTFWCARCKFCVKIKGVVWLAHCRLEGRFDLPAVQLLQNKGSLKVPSEVRQGLLGTGGLVEKCYKSYHILNQEKKVFSVYLSPTPKAGSTKYLPHQAPPCPPNPREGFADTSPRDSQGTCLGRTVIPQHAHKEPF